MTLHIDGVKLKPLVKIEDDRGKLLHMLRENSDEFKRVGEIYFSFTKSNFTKGWYRHKKNTLNIAVIFGVSKFVLFDARQSSFTYKNICEIKLSLENYSLLTIPPMVWYSFKNIGEKEIIIANCTPFVHNEIEREKLPINTKRIPYNWDLIEKGL